MTLNTRKPFDIRERAFEFSLAAVNLFSEIRKDSREVGWVMGKQFLRSSTSIGANLEEAKAGESRSDFIHKNNIALKEARETLYWLRIMRATNIVPATLCQSMISETNEIISILTAIINKAKQ